MTYLLQTSSSHWGTDSGLKLGTDGLSSREGTGLSGVGVSTEKLALVSDMSSNSHRVKF